MTLYTLLLFIPACFALNMAPGPNNLLSVANAKCHGLRVACLAGLGRLMAFVLMIGLAASGLAVVLYTSERIFLVIKVLGALYLFWLAFTLWNAREGEELDGDEKPHAADLLLLARREFLVAAGNPKAILIFTAFLPQFVDPAGNVAMQFAILGVLFLALEWIAIAAYAFVGSNLRQWFSRPGRKRWFNRVCAGLLASAGLGMLSSRQV
ncbi:LysE family translocator [Billgrantia endophytica]|uniref:Lysine transporter LysE n=1 Tax=Billgrantia endophytica TaxID=2033802 RepID=A0A2N7U7X3_9GAMM|nr:LysE family translocator [Halomonas endophytica]PMR76540.1 lysine transporter LysE [Halomonas endophytica]